MKKIIIALSLGCLFAFSGCGNKTAFDTVYTYDRAIISLPNDAVIDGEIQSWCDYEGEQLQVKIDGKYYLVSSMNCVLINE